MNKLMNIELRQMNKEDADAVTYLCKQLGYETTTEHVRNNIQLFLQKEDAAAFVAVHQNVITGWITVAYVLSISSPPVCEIRGLVVDEKFRKNNIGTMLIEYVKQWCKKKNCCKIRLRCNTKRHEAHNFYMHVGFTEKKEQKVFEIET
ncbi:MAG: GNAT family N-acetyltransferase [Parafilimonas sp.]|nr:GNAT family N-acetyltransferase [Parafilimonas sp.]